MTRLIEELRKLPGIGTKTAQRLAFHVLRSPAEDAEALAAAIQEIKKHLRLCAQRVQQHYGCGSLQLLHEPDAESAAGVRD